MKRNTAYMAIVACLLLVSEACGQAAATQLAVLPTAGKAAGCVTAAEPGKWIVFATGFVPVQPTLFDGGKGIVWEGDAGDYAVIFFPPNDGQPQVVKVTLGGAAPNPQPEPGPTPGGKKQVVLWYSEQQLDNLPQGQRDVLTSLTFRKWMRDNGHVLLEVLDPSNLGAGSVPERLKSWVTSVSGKELPAMSVAPKEGGVAPVTYALPKDEAAVKELLK